MPKPTREKNLALLKKHVKENFEKLHECPGHVFSRIEEKNPDGTDKKRDRYVCAHCGGMVDFPAYVWHCRGFRDAVDLMVDLSGPGLSYLQLLRGLLDKDNSYGGWKSEEDRQRTLDALESAWKSLSKDDGAGVKRLLDALHWEIQDA